MRKSLPILDNVQKMSPEERRLTLVNTILSFGQGISNLFLTIYLLKHTSSLVPVVVFNLFQYPGMMLMFIFFGILPFRLELRRILAIGFLLYVVCYGLLILLGNNASYFLIPIGILFGCATGTYWSANNTFIYLSTHDRTRDNYFAVNSSVGSIIAIIAPLVAGVILSQSTHAVSHTFVNYYLLFSVVITTFIFGFYQSHKLPRTKVPKISMRRTLRPFRVRVWQLVGLSQFIDGFKGGSIGFIATVFAFQILTRELNMAIFNSAFSIISAIFSYFLIGKLKPENRLKYGFVGAVLFLLVHFFYIALFSPGGIIISSFIGVFASSLFTLGLASTFFLLIDSNPEHKKEYFTYIAFREIPLNLGRIFGASLFLALLINGNEIFIAKTWYLLLGFVPVLFYYLTHKFNRLIEQEAATIQYRR